MSRRRRAWRRAACAAALLALALAGTACGRGDASAPAAGGAAQALPRGRLAVGLQIVDVEIADRFETRSRGLSGRRRLPDGHGMLFVYPVADRYGFWMPDMHFDLDLVWIRGDRVVGVTPDVPHDPPGAELPVYRPDEPADRVLEVPAGTAARHGWGPGTPVKLEPPADAARP